MQLLKSVSIGPEREVESVLDRLREPGTGKFVDMDGQLLSLVLDYSWADTRSDTGARAPVWM